MITRNIMLFLVKKLLEEQGRPLDDHLTEIFQKSSHPYDLSLYYLYLKIHQMHIQRMNDSPKILTIKYEDFCSNKEANTILLLEYCGINSSLAGKAMKAFQKDSQQGTVVSTENLNELDDKIMKTAEMLEAAQKIGSYLGFEDIFSSMRLPGTATVP